MPLRDAIGEPLPARLGALDLLGRLRAASARPRFRRHLRRAAGRRPAAAAERPQPAVRARLARRTADGAPFALPMLGQRALVDGRGRPLDAEALVLTPGGDVLVADEARGPAGPLLPPARRRRRPACGRCRGRSPSSRADQRGRRDAGAPAGRLAAGDRRGGMGRRGPACGRAADARTGRCRCAIAAARASRPTDADGRRRSGCSCSSAGCRCSAAGRRGSSPCRWPSCRATPDGRHRRSRARDRGRPGAGRELRGADGLARCRPAAIACLLVSDDNFNGLQRTQLLELRWRP